MCFVIRKRLGVLGTGALLSSLLLGCKTGEPLAEVPPFHSNPTLPSDHQGTGDLQTTSTPIPGATQTPRGPTRTVSPTSQANFVKPATYQRSSTQSYTSTTSLPGVPSANSPAPTTMHHLPGVESKPAQPIVPVSGMRLPDSDLKLNTAPAANLIPENGPTSANIQVGTPADIQAPPPPPRIEPLATSESNYQELGQSCTNGQCPASSTSAGSDMRYDLAPPPDMPSRFSPPSPGETPNIQPPLPQPSSGFEQN